MSIVIVGHVDHGKSTVIGRLMADTGSLPDGKLEQVRAMCKSNARPFEYAFLMDALKNEQAQGITIDTARCFFNTKKRHYIIIDAPGHIEFLKNMITGASRAEAAFLVIDANEGIKENSKRHGYMVSMLGIKQVSILVNKMDLVDYSQERFDSIVQDYTAFLGRLGVEPTSFIPISAFEGENITEASIEMPWYTGHHVLAQVDDFNKSAEPTERPFRMPVQDIYKFTAEGDDRRIVAGSIDTGTVHIGDGVRFLPSGKTSKIKSIECFNADPMTQAHAGQSNGFTLDTEIYIQRGELMVRDDEPPPQVSTRFKANLFWMGHAPMLMNTSYKLKLGAARAPVKLVDIVHVLDASELSTATHKKQIDRHDVAECILEVPKPIAFDLVSEIESTGRLVIVDNFEIAGAGIILESVSDDASTLKDYISEREAAWHKSEISAAERGASYRHGSKFILIIGSETNYKTELGTALEKKLFYRNFKSYYLGMAHMMNAMRSEQQLNREDIIRRLGELARILTDSGQIFISSIAGIDEYDIKILRQLNEPNDILVVNVSDFAYESDEIGLRLTADTPVNEAVDAICDVLKKQQVMEYYL